MSENAEGQDKLQVEVAPSASELVAESAAAAVTAQGGSGPIQAEAEDGLWEASAPTIEVTRQPEPFAGNTPIVVPQTASQRDRKWTRRVEDLPRSERWKRRLPQVCR